MALFSRAKSPAPLQVADPEEAKRIPVTREEIAILHKPQSQQAEQFRNLRNSIVALNPEGAPRTVLVTSALRGEGKTVATLNLAFALAEMPGAHVCVIDADMHDPSIEGYLGLTRRQGLSELLSGRLPPDQAIRATYVPGVSLLGAGAIPRNPSELLASDRMKELLRSLKRRFSYVLIDSPEATTTSDASLLGSITDGIILVVRLGATSRAYVEQAYTSLEALGGNVLGTCLTNARLRDTGRGYGR